MYIGQEAPNAALRFLDAVEVTLKLLTNSPQIGPPRDFHRTELSGLRSFPVKGFEKYLIFYRATPLGIEVLRVLHGARDLGAALGD